MGIPYEYKLVVKYYPIPEQISVASQEGQKGLTIPLAKFVEQTLPAATVDFGWVVNSHSITIVKNQIVLLVLLQRGLF
jgi:hypothetical protein